MTSEKELNNQNIENILICLDNKEINVTNAYLKINTIRISERKELIKEIKIKEFNDGYKVGYNQAVIKFAEKIKEETEKTLCSSYMIPIIDKIKKEMLE